MGSTGPSHPSKCPKININYMELNYINTLTLIKKQRKHKNKEKQLKTKKT